MKPVIIGIAGGTGSGKSTFTRRIQRAFPKQVTVLYLDSYYKAHDELSLQERRQLNYDHPDAYDINLLIRDLRMLKSGNAIVAPTYDFADYNRKKETVHISPSRVILVEGILALHYPELRSLFDIRIFVDADADERILRRVIRDTRERGRKLENIVDQYLTTVKPMHYLYVEPTRCYADIIVNSGKNDVAFELMRTHIASILQQKRPVQNENRKSGGAFPRRANGSHGTGTSRGTQQRSGSTAGTKPSGAKYRNNADGKRRMPDRRTSDSSIRISEL